MKRFRAFRRWFCLMLFPLAAIGQSVKTEELRIQHQADTVILAGTLTLPSQLSKHPTVAIFISGSGQTDRNSTLFSHQPFKRLANFLAEQGVVTFRYDDRGGYQSTGRNTSQSTTFDLATDAATCLNYLRKDKRFRHSKIGFIGHSEGGLIAPMAATITKPDFIVSLAGPGIPISELMKRQFATQPLFQKADSNYVDFASNKFYIPAIQRIIKVDTEKEALQQVKNFTDSLLTTIPSADARSWGVGLHLIGRMFVQQLNNTWAKAFFALQPTDYWRQVRCPVLAINGDLDKQVELNNLDAIQQAVPQKLLTISILESHNHLFQKTQTGDISAYRQLVPTFSDETHQIIIHWLKTLPKKRSKL